MLLAARVLSDFYETVRVVKRDKLSGDAAPRRGVRQGRRSHALCSRGSQELAGLFPGLSTNSSPPARRSAMTATFPGVHPAWAGTSTEVITFGPWIGGD